MDMEQVCDITIALLRHQGVRATRMEDVRVFLDLSKDMFYRTFPDKETLLLKCMQNEIRKEEEIIERLCLRLESPLMFIIKLYSHSVRYFYSFHVSFFRELKKYPKCYAELSRLIAIWKMKYNEILGLCIRKGLCKPDCDTFLFSTFLCIRITEIKEGIIIKKELEQSISDFVIRTMLCGCCTYEGRKMLVG